MYRGRGGGGGGGGTPYFMPNPYVQLPPNLVKQMEEAFSAQKYLTATKTEVEKGKVANRVTEAETQHIEAQSDIAKERLKQESSKSSRSVLDTVNKVVDTTGKVAKTAGKAALLYGAYKTGGFVYKAYNDPFNTMYDAATASRSSHLSMAKGATLGFAGIPREWVQTPAYKQFEGKPMDSFYPTQDVPPGEGQSPIGPWPQPRDFYSKTQGFKTVWDFRDTPEDMLRKAENSFWQK
jgi:hypothetical protein